MAFDGVAIACIRHELEQLCVGGRVDKILQPERDEICLVIRAKGNTYRLLVSASSANPRVHLTEIGKENPIAAPMFCMLLRKHLSGGKLVGVEQPEFERILQLLIESRNELGDVSVKRLVVEIMGRCSNIVLLDENSRVLGSIKHVDFSVSSVRQLIPGMEYEMPPGQGKENPLTVNGAEIHKIIERGHGPADKWLMNSFTGIGPMTAREVVYGAVGTASIPLEELSADQRRVLARQTEELFEQIKQGEFRPVLLYKKEQIWEFSAVSIDQYQGAVEVRPMERLNQTVDCYYKTKDLQERMHQKTADLLRFVDNNIQRCQKKLALQQQKLKDCENKEQDKEYGDLLIANLYRIPEAAESVEVENYYHDNQPVTIRLSPELTPSQNAQRYYTKYQKAKTAEVMTAQQMELANQELDYLESVKESLQLADCERDIGEIRSELLQQGYLVKRAKQGNKSRKQQQAQPLKYTILDGFEVLVGKNNLQNDELTLRQSARNDLWFHTKQIHGSHTVIRTAGRQPSDDVIVVAAKICAYYSKARNSANVPVDYTTIKNVKKPNGAKPGMVIYDNYQTVNVTPELPRGIEEQESRR